MIVASFNVENLFNRAKVFNEDQQTTKKYLTQYKELSTLFEKVKYTDSDKVKMIGLINSLGLAKSDASEFVLLRKVRGKLIQRKKNSNEISIVANGRADWIGWLDLKTEPVDEIAMQNTARVIRDLNADVTAVVEAESRVTLKKFSDLLLTKVKGNPYDKVMLVDGNDERGIDVGLMARFEYKIESVSSHIYDKNDKGNNVFSRDLPEYKIITPSGETIWILPAHFKSKFGGNDSRSQSKRKGEAERAAAIYKRLKEKGYKNVIICGDFNDTPGSDPLSPLLTGTDLKDFSEHKSFQVEENTGIGTYGNGADNNKIDYILLSPELFKKIKSCGIFRKGAWAGKLKPKWEMYEELTSEVHAASDHHAVWCEIDIN